MFFHTFSSLPHHQMGLKAESVGLKTNNKVFMRHRYNIAYFLYTANYKAVQCLTLTSLNPQRSSILLRHFMETGQGNAVAL